MMQADDVLQILHSYGKYSNSVYFLLCFVILRGVFSVFSIMYMAPATAHTCNTDKMNSSNVTVVPSSCYVQSHNGTNNLTLQCTQWSYDKTPEESIISQWNLVCGENSMTDLSTVVYMIGNLFGCLLLMPLADKFGRKLILNLLLSVQLVLNITLVFSCSIVMFTILRFFIAASNIASSLIAYCMLSEVLPATHRTLRVIGATSFWSIGIMLLALAGHFISNWKLLQIVVSLPNLIVIILWWFLPESISWLFTHRKFEKIIEILMYAAKWDKKFLEEGLNLPPPLDTYQSLRLLENIPLQTSVDGIMGKSQDTHYREEDQPPMFPDQTLDYKHLNGGTNVNNNSQNSSDMIPQTNINGCSNIITTTTLCSSEPVPQTNINSCSDTTITLCYSSEPGPQSSINQNFEVTTLSVRSLFFTPRMLGYTLIMFYIATINSLSYFGILLSTPSLPGNLSLNLFWTAVCEIFAYMVTMVIANKLGCRRPMSVMMLIAGLSNVAAYFLITFYAFQTRVVYIFTIICAMVGRFGMSGSYSILYLLFTELFPTPIRNQAMGFASFFENLGAIFAPIMILTTKTVPFLLLLIFAALNLVGSFLILLFPETHLMPLPNSVQQVEQWSTKNWRQVFSCRTSNADRESDREK
ncbi:solute carrier family 22 member 4-like [Argonauta hians]